jgi:mono/diheme cytochrome c family protein
MNHSTARRTLAALLAGGGLVAFATTVGAQGIGVDELERMLVPTDKKIERGKRVYQNQCAGCHGDDGKGNVEYPAEKFANPVPDFTSGKYRHGEGPVQVYNTISKGILGDKEASHPTYADSLRYQQRWAVTHYVRSLSDTKLDRDPREVMAKARNEAKNGVCDPAVRQRMEKNVEPSGEEQMKLGKQVYESQCQSCHGKSGKGNGPAGQALQPSPRNFQSADAEWVNGTSPFGIMTTLNNGIEGAAMSSYKSLSTKKRWAVTHYLRQWIPEKRRKTATEQDILDACRAASGTEPPEPIDKERAIQALIDDQPEDRYVHLARLGPIQVASEASIERGRKLYEQQCAECHGEGLQGVELGPLAVERVPETDASTPLLSFEVRGLVPAHAGGDYRDFARRSAGGVHTTLPDMTSASLLSEDQWKDLHAYVASVDAEGDLGKLRPGDVKVGLSSSEKSDSNSEGDSDSDSDKQADENTEKNTTEDSSGTSETSASDSQNADSENADQ